VYFARPDSYVFGQSVNEARTALGRQLAREQPADADVIVPIPDSGVCAAVGFAEASGIPLRMGLIRNHYVGRTFIEPRQSIRHFGVRVKLNPVRSILEGQRVVLVDDSIVRGTTSRKIVKMVRAAGAREVHMRISCPPTISPCFYGVDTPRRSELIAATHTLREIQKYIEADSLGYLSLEGLLGAVGPNRGNYCTSCYTGQYPVAFPRSEAAYLQLALKLDPASEARRAANDERARTDEPRVVEREVPTTTEELSVMTHDEVLNDAEEDVKLGAGKR
jgi:amidophosphoribosyltransferase